MQKIKTNVFRTQTRKNTGNYHKKPIKQKEKRVNVDSFVKMTKIGIEILKAFVYNVFIAAIETKTAA